VEGKPFTEPALNTYTIEALVKSLKEERVVAIRHAHKEQAL
jgi:hypothetical protein